MNQICMLQYISSKYFTPRQQLLTENGIGGYIRVKNLSSDTPLSHTDTVSLWGIQMAKPIILVNTDGKRLSTITIHRPPATAPIAFLLTH